MEIGTLGAGAMARALATPWVRAGHDVRVGGREPARAAATATAAGGRPGTLAEAAAAGEVVLVALPALAAPAAVASVADVLRPDAVLLDCTNPVGPDGVNSGPGASVADRLAAVSGRPVVKGFNLCHEGIWSLLPLPDRSLTVPVTGPDDALTIVEPLVRAVGAEPVRTGGPDRAWLLEAAAALFIGIWFKGGDPATAIPPVEVAMGGVPHPPGERGRRK